MKKKVDIYIPRLDVSFKKGAVPEKRGQIEPIRVHWVEFVKALRKRHLDLGHQVRVIETPLWQISVDLVRDQSDIADIIYIPHKMRENWYLDSRVRYYMQMVIPNVFSIDQNGWCASSSSYPIQPDNGDAIYGVTQKLQDRARSNISKFPQPDFTKTDNFESGFVLFACQLPHDETIKYHSNISVEDALRSTLNWIKHCKQTHNYKRIVIKSHPINRASMKPLYDIYKEYQEELGSLAMWVDDMSIHELITKSKMVVTVNSGAGFESILHNKPVFTFGRADYDSVTTSYTSSDLDQEEIFKSLESSYKRLSECQIFNYRKFVDSWYNTHYDYSNLETFQKIQ